MWPFSAADTPEIKQDVNGVFIELNDEEQQEVKKRMDMLRGRTEEGENVWREDVIDEVTRIVTSQGLLSYAMGEVFRFEDSGDKTALYRALSSVFKAYISYPLPIYIYDYAFLLAMDGRIDEARTGFSAFIEQQTNFQPNEFQELALDQRDINEAMKDARAKIKG
jgi:hypothetical protein